MGMISLFRQSKIPVATIIEGMGMSAGSILFAMGTEGMRYIAPEGTLMIHDASSMTWGKVEEIKADATQMDKLNKTIYETMAENCGKPKNYFLDLIHKHSHADWYLDAEDAVKHNLANKIGVPHFIIDIEVKYSMV
jgi:ATP-dependent Clp protease protease subunit